MNALERAVNGSSCIAVSISYAMGLPTRILSSNNCLGDQDTILLHDMIHPDDVQPIYQIVNDIVNKGEEAMSAHFRLPVDNGYHWFYISATAVRDENDVLISIDGMLFDVSQYLDCDGDDQVINQYRQQNAKRQRNSDHAMSLKDLLDSDYLGRIQKPFAQIEGLYSAIIDNSGEFVSIPKHQDSKINPNRLDYQRKKNIRINHQSIAYWIIASDDQTKVDENAQLLETLVQTISRIANSFVVLYNEMENSQNANRLLGQNIEEQIFINNIYSILLESPTTRQSLEDITACIARFFDLDRVVYYHRISGDLYRTMPNLSWTRDGINNITENEFHYGDFPELTKDFEYDKILFFDDICNEFGMKNPVVDLDIRGASAAQVIEHGKCVGIIFFSTIGAPREWSVRDRKIIKSVTQILSSIILRVRIENELEESQNQLRYLAYYDQITKLPNRLKYEQDINEGILSAQTGAVISFEIANFNKICEIYGHSYGDMLLNSVAQYIDVMPIDNKTVYRYSTNLLFIELSGCDAEHAKQLVETLIYKYKRPWYLNENFHLLNISIGIALYPENGKTAEEITKATTLALYRAKEFGNNSYAFYARAFEQYVDTNLRMENRLRQAIADNFHGFVMNYQPVFSAKDERVNMCEAFVRWNDEELGSFTQSQFIPVAEYVGLAHEIDKWALDKACEFCARVHEMGFTDFCVSVNATTHELQSHTIIDNVEDALHRHSLQPSSLVLEIPEKAQFHNMNDTSAIVFKLRGLGVKLALDNFGTEFLTLAPLKSSSVSILKLSKDVFLAPDDDFSLTLAGSIINLAHSKKIQVCAKTIESFEQVRELSAFDIDLMQGFLFSKPLLDDEFINRFVANYVPLTK